MTRTKSIFALMLFLAAGCAGLVGRDDGDGLAGDGELPEAELLAAEPERIRDEPLPPPALADDIAVGLTSDVTAAEYKDGVLLLHEDTQFLDWSLLTAAEASLESDMLRAILHQHLEPSRVALRVLHTGTNPFYPGQTIGAVIDGELFAGDVLYLETDENPFVTTTMLVVDAQPAVHLFAELDATAHIRPDPEMDQVVIRLDELEEGETPTCPAGANCVFTSAALDARDLLDEFLADLDYIPQPNISSLTDDDGTSDETHEAAARRGGDEGEDRFKNGTGCDQETRQDIYTLMAGHYPMWISQIRSWARDNDDGKFPMGELPSDEKTAFRSLVNDEVGEADGACVPAVIEDIVDAERLRDSPAGRTCEVSHGVNITPILDFSPNIDSRFSIEDREFYLAAAGQVNAGVVAQVEAGATLSCTVDFIRIIEKKFDIELRVKIPIITLGGVDIVYAYFEPVLEAKLDILASIGRVRFQHIRHQAFAGIFGYSKTAYPNRTPAIQQGFNARVVRLDPQDWDGGNDGVTNSLDLELSEHIAASASLRAGLRVGLFAGVEIDKKIFGIKISLVKAGVSAYGQVYGAITGTFRLGDADPTSADCHWHGRVNASIEALAGYRVSLKLLGIQVLNLHGETPPWVIWEPADQDGDGHSDPLWEDSWPSRFCPGHSGPFVGFDPCFTDTGAPTYSCESACNDQELDQSCGILVDCVRPPGYCDPDTSSVQVSSECGWSGGPWGSDAIIWTQETCNPDTCLWVEGEESVYPCTEGDPPQCFYDPDNGNQATCCTFSSTDPSCFI